MTSAPGSPWRRPGSVGAIGAAAGLAGLAGAFYSYIAYAVDPRTVPLAMVALASVALGLWRAQYGVALLVLAFPLTENAPISDPGAARLRIALILWVMALAALHAVRLLLDRTRIPPPPLLGSAVVMVAAAVVTVPQALDVPSAAAKTLLLAGAVTVYLLIAVLLPDRRRLAPVLHALVLIGLAVALHALYQYLTGQLSAVGFAGADGEVRYRVASLFPHPNMLAAFASVLVPISLGLSGLLQGRWRLACIALVLLGTLTVLLTFSRGGLLALAAAPVLYLRDRRAWPLLILLLIVAVAVAPAGLSERLTSQQALGSTEFTTRLDFWRAALTLFGDHPFLGVGLNSFGAGYLTIESSGRSFLGGGIFAVPETAHNLYLNILAEQGLVGFAALLVLAWGFVQATRELRQDRDPALRQMGLALRAAGLVVVVHNLLDVTFFDAKNAMLIWIVLGITAALVSISRRERASVEA